MANRWLAQPGNMDLKGDALLKALDGQDWDASVKSLVPFPTVLKTMSDQLDWTQKLGDAFLAQQSRRVCRGAGAARQSAGDGNLAEQHAADRHAGRLGDRYPAGAGRHGCTCPPTIRPSSMAHGPIRPIRPPTIRRRLAITSDRRWRRGLPSGLVSRSPARSGAGERPNWGSGSVNVNVNRFNSINANSVNANRLSNRAVSSNTWQHNADHRRGVGYTNPQVRQQYRPNSAGNAATRDAFRGGGPRGDDGLGAGRAAHRRRRNSVKRLKAERGRLAQPARKSGKPIAIERSRLAQPARQSANASRPNAGGGGSNFQGRPANTSRPNPAGAGNAQARLQNVQRPSGGRGAPAFNGVGHGAATRAQSAQGHASRAGAAHGGGVARGGGGARAGGGAARGGRR